MLNHPNTKYRSFPPIQLKDRTWPNRVLTQPPIWMSTDLRDGNQALFEPMNAERKMRMFNMEAAQRGASERLVPILMTALVTALGLLPLALYSGAPGNEIEGPMAIVILGGLITSTVLNLLVLPTLALRFGRFEKNTDAMESPVRAG